MQLSCNTGDDNPVLKALEDRAAAITIIRDKWGIPHIYGKSDADAVFGLMYAQCEESFERVERNYIQRLGRLAEIEGEKYLYQDLQTRLIYDTAEAILDYRNSPSWLKELLDGFADGVNYYLLKHPEVRPKLLTRFEPWYPLMFTDGGYTATQTGGAELSDLKNLYGSGPAPGTPNTRLYRELNPNGSNAFAIGPSRSASGKALLYINPHVSFYFRTEAHMVSEQGLNAYGAVTWGQFFVYQGFNEFCGWMHTSSLADASDLYEESVVRKDGALYYQYNDSLRKITNRQHVFRVRVEDKMRSVPITAFYTHHGPVVGKRNEKWLSLREENRTINGLIQSWQRTKSKSFDDFEQSMKLRSNNSCNTMYADQNGTIAYWHGNFIPVRNPTYNYTTPLDGRNPNTEWQGVHGIGQLVFVKNPKSGWLQNCNSDPFLVTDTPGLDKGKYQPYMAPDGENFRSVRARQLLRNQNLFTLEKLIAIGYDRYLSIFDSILPPLLHSFEELKTTDSLYMILKEPIHVLKNWDRYASVSSIALSLGAEWAYKLMDQNYSLMTTEEGSDQVKLFSSFARKNSSRQLLDMLREVIRDYEKIYRTWRIPWGELVRFQRITGDIHPKFDDNSESVPVGLASSLLGCLPAYESVWAKTYRSYGVAGNSFVAAVEFGDRIKAKSIVTAGQSFQPGSKNFKDQLPLFLEGKLKDVLFYKEDVLKNSSKTYHPGIESSK
jgi:acyl-homoserine lactone acylase PvdQ